MLSLSKKSPQRRKADRATRTVLRIGAGGAGGPCTGLIFLAEELAAIGHVEMARSLSSNTLSLWKGLDRRQASRLQRIGEPPRRLDTMVVLLRPRRSETVATHSQRRG